jgi:hypothetical protein
MGDEKPRSSMKRLVIGTVLLLVVSALTVALIPFNSCPTCAGKGQLTVMKYMPQTCPMCDGRGKTTLLKDWLRNPANLKEYSR